MLECKECKDVPLKMYGFFCFDTFAKTHTKFIVPGACFDAESIGASPRKIATHSLLLLRSWFPFEVISLRNKQLGIEILDHCLG